ncbi:TIGR02996 domain-containing protein [Gemmata sp.]|uniref:TIGR02996 domain-containing protein n=1 Tax=Gemmata sp. TaxID=1914242 RepID=UPI003F70DDE8
MSSFLEAVRLAPEDDTARLALADWLDEMHPATPVAAGVPKGFNAYWHQRAVPAELLVGFQYRRLWAAGKWSNEEISEALVTVVQLATTAKIARTVRPGSTEVAGYPVLTLELIAQQPDALALCRVLQRRCGGCPVTYSRRAARSPQASRVGIWFTAMPGERQLIAEAVEKMFRRPHRYPSE